MSKIDLSSINKKHNGIVTEKKIIKKNINEKAPTNMDLIPKQQFNAKPDKPTHIKKSLKSGATKATKPSKNIPDAIKLSENDRAKKIKLLELYVIEFPEELSKYKNHNFKKCTDQQLVELKDDFDKCVCSKNNLHWGVNISQKALEIYEMVGKMSGLEVDGISKLGSDPEWIKNIKAVCLKYLDGGITIVEPEHQLLFMLIQNTMTLHYLNSSKIAPVKIPSVENNVNESSPIAIKLELNQVNNEYSDI